LRFGRGDSSDFAATRRGGRGTLNACFPSAVYMARLDPKRIAAAVRRIDPVFLGTPQGVDAALSAWLGCELVLKDETANPIRCFKGRGASAFVAQRESRAPLVCASAGNFGLGLAHACAKRGMPLTVFVSRRANPAKVAGIRGFGARIEVAGEDFDAAKSAARAFDAEFVEDGRELAITEGAGSIGVELMAEFAPDAVVLSLGNGALLAGVAAWVKHHSPATAVIGVVAAGAPAMRQALRDEATSAFADTFADGIAVRVPVPEAVIDLKPLVDDVLVVSDDALRATMRELQARSGRLAEPSAVAGLAAVAADPARFAGRRVATVLTGANLAP
jgi:threonine dehydratase